MKNLLIFEYLQGAELILIYHFLKLIVSIIFLKFNLLIQMVIKILIQKMEGHQNIKAWLVTLLCLSYFFGKGF
jgi:hypothetical protein